MNFPGERGLSNTELSSPPVPPLVEGERLTRNEFERRYHAMPGLKKAELIEGVVHMPSTVSLNAHGTPHAFVTLNAKLAVYQRNGIREYIIWRVEKQQVDWFILRDGKYTRLAPTPTGLLCSETFPGLWLDRNALFQGDFVGVMTELQRGIQDPAHTAFVAELKHRSGSAIWEASPSDR